MAKRTVGDWDGEGKREAGAAALDEALSKSMAALAKELAARLMESGSSAPRVDGLVREAVLEAARRGLEEAAECDRSDCGAANAPRCCRGRMRCAGRERSATETAPGRVRLAMGRYVCLSCGKSARPRASRLDVEGSMTPTARRMASELGSACCCAEADRLLNVVAGVNFGAKRVERTTRLVGDDLERWRTEWLSGSITVVGGDGEAWNDASFDGRRFAGRCGKDGFRALDWTARGFPRCRRRRRGGRGRTGARRRGRPRSARSGWSSRTAKAGCGRRRVRRGTSRRSRARRTTRRATRRWRGGCCANWRRQPRALGALRPPRRLVRRLLGTPPQAGRVRRWRTLTQNLSHTRCQLPTVELALGRRRRGRPRWRRSPHRQAARQEDGRCGGTRARTVGWARA